MTGNQFTAVLEDIDSKLDLILEAHQSLAPLPSQVQQIDTRLMVVESDVKVIKAVVTDQSRQLNSHDTLLVNHETRLTNLENSQP